MPMVWENMVESVGTAREVSTGCNMDPDFRERSGKATLIRFNPVSTTRDKKLHASGGITAREPTHNYG